MENHWMQTLSGKRFEAYNPHEDQICIEDIAHALSMLCRFNGHIEKFYSVADHSVRCSHIVAPGFELEALLHDAVEAYIGDMPSPVKRGQREFINLEETIYEAAIAHKFGLPPKMSPEVKKADLQMLKLEKKFLIKDYGYDWHLDDIEVPEYITRITPLTMNQGKVLFLSRFEELTQERGVVPREHGEDSV